MRRSGSVVMALVALGCAPPRPPEPPAPDPALRAALLERANQDQQDMQALAAQRRFLSTLRVAVAAQDAPPVNLAYLDDRVRRADGRLQLYATQPDYDTQGNAVAPPVEAPESLDVRRARVGLPPIAAYLDQLNATNAQLRAMQAPPRK